MTSSVSPQASPASAKFLSRLFARGMWMAWLALVIGLAFALASWRQAADSAGREAALRFESAALDVRDAIRERMTAYEQVLRGGAGLFAASISVERHEWKSYVEHLRLQRHIPGIQGIGFAPLVTARERDAHTRAIRAQGFPDYAIRPDGERPEYAPIVYIEPFSSNKLRVLGYDMFSEPARRAAMERARDTGEAALSAKVTMLMQGLHEDMQVGGLMYAPVYRNGAPHATVAERRAALAGYVYSPVRMNELVNGILGARTPQLDLEIYDGAELSPGTRMYDDGWHAPVPPRFVRNIALEVSGRTWTLRIASTPEFEIQTGSVYPQIMLASGLVIGVLMFLTIASLATLRKSELRARNIVHSALDAIVIIDSGGRIVEFNPSAERVFGYGRGEALGEELAELIVPAALREAHRKGLARYIETGASQVLGRLLEMRALRADGREFPVELTVVPVAGIEPPLFAGFMRDISERRRAEETLHESEAQHKAIVESTLDAIIVNDGEGRITEFNPAAVRTFGYRRDEVLGKDLAELLIPGGDGEIRRRKFRGALASGAPEFQDRRVEVPALHADGHEFPIEITVQRIDRGGRIFFTAFIRDLTDNKRSAAMLREKEEIYRVLFESSQDAIMTLAPPSWAFTSGNRAALRMFAVQDEAKFVSLGPWELSPEIQPDGRPSSEKAQEAIATAMREGAHFFEWTHKRYGGESFPATVLLTRVALGARVFLQATVRDISVQKQAEAELKRRAAEIELKNRLLETSDRSKSEFLATMSHELRTPLNAIIGFANLLRKTPPGADARVREYAADIEASGSEMLALVNDMLELAKIEAGKTELQLDPADICQIARDAVAARKGAAALKRIAMQVDAADTGECLLDAHKVRQMLDQLLSNAIKFTPDGGRVGVRIGRDSVDSVILAVSDTGIGIAAADLPRLFEPFSQLDATLSRKYGGTGIGLALVKRLAEEQGGTAGVASEPGKGSTFTVKLPFRAVT
jgi:PAS domain S-box-containing protein